MRPWKYLAGLGMARIVYPITRRPVAVRARAFYGADLRVPLPAGLDIYLTGLKAHDSEMRLTRYLIGLLRPGMSAIDAGAHLGYYALLMARCVGPAGRVAAFEPSRSMATWLGKNTAGFPQLNVEPRALGQPGQTAVFYEYAAKYSEYNTTVHVHEVPVRMQRQIAMIDLDSYCNRYRLRPDLIKIDVEGGEHDVILGGSQLLIEQSPVVVIELRIDQYHDLYRRVVEEMRGMGYQACRIDRQGQLIPETDVHGALIASGLESDNFVFVRAVGR